MLAGLFRGVPMIVQFEMGTTAARQPRDLAAAGRFVAAVAVLPPILGGPVGVASGHAIGLSQGGAFLPGAICASATGIDAPAACRATLPEASPRTGFTASPGVTFPFNLLFGLPPYRKVPEWLYA
ncbi:sodium-dependent bicarbonate transport family permease [Neoroseomonas soli]|uniref:Sodium-dependent bicarbonate transport family permease n=1 Tax=Neoroseomonas soli TaxID=1081025 RepID=A0A9X9WX08_9PROT|nr:sodium-dependent bicarbonate transport family permease [Neoroseomonas soli]MBR0671687.1 sodium-dependent bicarbonate transport family permease [Neoroseomonas soli]